MTQPVIQVTELDHIVLRCHDIEASLSWYLDVLGLAPERVDEWRSGAVPFPSVRVNADTIIDLLPADDSATTGPGRLDHFCLVIEPVDLDILAAGGRFDVVDGPGRRSGARGDGTSLYVRDPEGSIVELRHY